MYANEVWELAKKIMFIDKDGGFTSKQFQEIFPQMNKGEVFELSPYEVMDRVAAYEKEHELKVGDIFEDGDYMRYVVVDTDIKNERNMLGVFDGNGCFSWIENNFFKKVGETDLISKLLVVLNEY